MGHEQNLKLKMDMEHYTLVYKMEHCIVVGLFLECEWLSD